MVRGLLLVLAVAGLLLSGPGLTAATAGLPAPEMAVSAQPTHAAAGEMPCCHPAESGTGLAKGGPVKGGQVKGGMMGCPVACGGWPAQALLLPEPVSQPLRLALPRQGQPDSLDPRPAYRPPILPR